MINRLRKYTLCDGILFFSKLLRFCGLEMVVLVGVNVILSFGKYKVKVNWALISFLAINFHRKKHFWGHEHSTLTAIDNDWRVDGIFKVVFSYCSSAVEFRCGNCWKERILLRKLTWIVEGSSSDRRGSRRRRRKETAAEESSSSRTGSAVDRPGRPHVHSVHRVRERSTAWSTEKPDCKYPTLCWAPGRPAGRPTSGCGLQVQIWKSVCI